jgi:hypothetical protein
LLRLLLAGSNSNSIVYLLYLKYTYSQLFMDANESNEAQGQPAPEN